MAKHVLTFTVTHPSLPAGKDGRRTVEVIKQASGATSDTDFDLFWSILKSAGREALRVLATQIVVDPKFFETTRVHDQRSRTKEELAADLTDFDFTERVRALFKELRIIDVVKLEGETRRYMGHGTYPEDEGGGLWKEEVQATCQSEAEYLTRMKMAEELCWTSTYENPREFSSVMDDLKTFDSEAMDIQRNDPKFEQGFEDLLKAAIEAGLEGDVVDRAVELLRKAGRDVDVPHVVQP